MRRYLFITLPICGILIADWTSLSTDVTLTCIPGDSTPAGVGTLRVSALDVGQGDSILIPVDGRQDPARR